VKLVYNSCELKGVVTGGSMPRIPIYCKTEGYDTLESYDVAGHIIGFIRKDYGTYRFTDLPMPIPRTPDNVLMG